MGSRFTESLTFVYLFGVTQVKCEVGIKELMAISINNVPGSNVPKMSKTTLKSNHKRKGIQFFPPIKFSQSYNSKIKDSDMSFIVEPAILTQPLTYVSAPSLSNGNYTCRILFTRLQQVTFTLCINVT